MSALDRLSSYSAKRGLQERSDVFDCTTPEGAFFERVHRLGYNMYAEDEDGNTHFTELHDCIEGDGNQLINAIAGSGKALKNGTGVLTNKGYVPIETLHIGDKVFGRDGKLYDVVGVFPQGLQDAYEVEFSDGNTIICNDSHLWNVQTDSQRTMMLRKKNPKSYKESFDTKSLREIIDSHPLRTKNNKHNCYLPMTEQLQFDSEVVLPVPPYLIGYLIGNGGLYNRLRFSTADESVLIKIQSILEKYYPNCYISHIKDYDYAITTEPGHECTKDNKLYADLRALKLVPTESNTKFIPEIYLFSSIENRIELLKGLIDADGYYAGSYYEYTTASDRLSDNIRFLCEGLGLTVKHVKRPTRYYNEEYDKYIECKWSNRLNIKQSDKLNILFDSARVRKEFVQGQNFCRRTIENIIKLDEQVEMTCIQVNSPDRLFLTEHCIPTHNTTYLSLKIIHDIVTGETVTMKAIAGGQQVRVVNKVWVCTFLRSGAIELEQSLLGWQRELGYSQTANQINFSTLDAEFKRCLDAMGVKTKIGDASKLHSLFIKAVNSCNVTRNGYPLNKEDYQILSSIITYCRGRLDNKKYQHPSMSDYDLTPTIIDLIINQFATLRQIEGIMDFDEITELLYKFLYTTPNPAVQNFVSERYNFIYIDEFQDTSQIQYAILKFYARGKLWLNRDGEVHDDCLYTGIETLGKIIGVGDVSQCIYSFKGSDSHIIAEDFDRDFRPAIGTLSYNWRCPTNILNPVISSIHENRDSKSQQIIASREGGEFEVVGFTTYKKMIEKLMIDIEQDLKDDYTVGLLCRTNFDGVIPALMLESSEKFNFSISGENMTMDSPLPSKLIKVASLFTERTTPTVESTLKLFVQRGGEYEIKQLMQVCKNNNFSIWSIPDQDLRYSVPRLADFIINTRNMFYDSNGKRLRDKEISTLRYLYHYLYSNVFANDTAYCMNARAYIEALIYLLDNKGYKTVYEYLEDIDFLNDKLKSRIKKSKAQIHVVTVHEAKGKEWDSVYIWNDSQGVFPSAKCDVDDIEQLEEERRVHYIACTRAKKRERIYCLQDCVGDFVDEMECEVISYTPNIAQTLNKGA